MRAFLWLLLQFALVSIVLSDKGFYGNSVGAFLSSEEVNLRTAPVLQASILLNGDAFAGTNQQLYATFKGTFASSGPHPLGVFSAPGGQYSTTLRLDRKIGELVGVWLEVKGADSLLLQSFSCRLGSKVYELTLSQQWLEAWDPALAATGQGDGFSPDASLRLPSSPSLFAPVAYAYTQFTTTGIAPDLSL